MTSVVELTKIGQELGYTEGELRQCVKDEQAREREERHSRLEVEKTKLEVEKTKSARLDAERESDKQRVELEVRLHNEKAESDKERVELEVRLQKEKAESDKERVEYEVRLETEKLEVRLDLEAKLERQKLDIEKAKLQYARQLQREKEQFEAGMLETEHKMKIERDTMSKKGKVKVKMSPFDEKIDSMDAYLNVYETYANAQNWEPEIWSLNLPFLLKGTAREVFDRLPLEDRKDYDKLKDALLRQFELTDDGYK